MKRNTTIALAAVLLLILGTGGWIVAYKGYKKYQARQNQEFRYEGTMGKPAQGFQLDAFKRHLLRDDAIEHVIVEQKLVDAWGLDDLEAAKIRMRSKSDVNLVNAELKVSYQDKNKQIAHDILKAIVQRYYEQLQAAEKDQ
ncbi:MAG: hypothetical protein P8P36_07130 [Akkermansiaceae bacterium]|nr:hypothetical protein [Akkermansiaceae bacterium]